ncbi:hypothetical protein TRFO_33451 [Tritrichomonas foetus]|uniref:Uncharacterized protein n=1 Tax=Tritrichomonas foetus TaxID=1144522 RepID=A0A1J4JR46_9EUKA|nr:hypothetical protein TRFO_33451 [Tritrichomonas foetus]|eukprot:OHS99989.1 hypothetical protein TRFO_33451 [Tritrichomonas foetus]
MSIIKKCPFGEVIIEPNENDEFIVSLTTNKSPKDLFPNIFGESHIAPQGYIVFSGAVCGETSDNHMIKVIDFENNLLASYDFSTTPKNENYKYFLICLENFNYLLVGDNIFIITENSITPIELIALFPDGKPLNFKTMFHYDSLEYDKKPNVFPFIVDDCTYVILQNLLFKMQSNEKQVIFKAVDEQLTVFSWSSVYVENLGIVTFNTKDNMFPNVWDEDNFSLEMKKKSGTIFDPINKTLKSFDNEIPQPIHSSVTFTYNDKQYYVLLLRKMIQQQNEHSISIIGFDLETTNPLTFDFNLKDENYKYQKKFSMSDAIQYEMSANNMKNNLYISKNIQNWMIYLPKAPYSNYRIRYGYGKIPECFKHPDYEEVDLSDIYLKIGAPIFYISHDPESTHVKIGSIAPSRNHIFHDKVSIQEGESVSTFIDFSNIVCIGIIQSVNDNDLHSVDEIPEHTWKNPIQDFVLLEDGDSIVADDPGDLWSDISRCPKASNCLGGKWKASIDYYKGRARYLCLFHSDYLHEINSIPKGELYSFIPEDLEKGSTLQQLPGWESIGNVGSDIALSMLCHEKHFFNPDDIVFREDIDDLNSIGNYVITGFVFRPTKRETVIRQAISELICKTIDLDRFTKMSYLPFGVVSESGWGDGGYAVFSKKIDGKTVAVLTAFI